MIFDGRNAFWIRVLLVASMVFALQGVTWIVLGSFDPFGIYDRFLAQALWGTSEMTPEAKRGFQFAVGLLGATNAGFFVLFHGIVKHALARGERWGHQFLVLGTASWFVLDSAISIAMNAWFNVFLVNVPCLLILGVPLWGLRKNIHE